jgi:hypothetical protein
MTKHDPTKTMSVPAAGRIYFNLGRNASYEAAKRGDIPTITMGRKKSAVIPAIERMLAEAGKAKGV